jgi:hypothetical protein
MAKCSKCGQEVSIWSRDVITGACPECRQVGPRPGSLGCGTLSLIALIVLVCSNSGSSDLASKVWNIQSSLVSLQNSVDELKKASDVETKEIRMLRKSLEDVRKSGANKDK